MTLTPMHFGIVANIMIRKLLPFICVRDTIVLQLDDLSQEILFAGSNNDPLSLNLYTYCHNNPVSGTDSTGHFLDTFF